MQCVSAFRYYLNSTSPVSDRGESTRGQRCSRLRLPPTYDMTATIVYVAKKKASAKHRMAIVSVMQRVGPVASELAGWMRLMDTKAKKGDTFEIPSGMTASTKVDGDFNRLIIQ